MIAPLNMGAVRATLRVVTLVLVIVQARTAWAQSGDPPEAARLSREAAQLYQQGRYAESAKLAQQVVDIRRQALGPEHPDTLQALLDLSRADRGAGEYTKAAELAEHTLSVRERTAGASDPATAEALLAVAEAYRSQGRYGRALPLAQRALEIREHALGANHPDTAASLHSLAELYRCTGEYAQALPLAQRALKIREHTRGAEHPDTAESMNDLGVLYMDMRNYEGALPQFQQALAIRQKVLGADHPMTAESMGNLAALSVMLKEYKQALPLFERALAIKEKTLGPEHRETANTLTNLAELYRGLGDYGKAEPLLKRLVTIKEKTLGPEHPETARSLNNLAGLYWSMGEYAKAQPLLQRAEVIWEKALGPEHPDTARAWNLLAALSRSAGDYPQALSAYRRGLAAEQRTLQSVFAVSSEEQKLQYLERTQGHYLAALSLIQHYFVEDQDAVRFGLDLVLRHKGIVLDAQARTRDAIAGHLQGETLRSWERLAKDRSALAALLLNGPGEQGPEEYQRSIAVLQAAIAQEEQRLSPQSGVVAQELAQQQVAAEMLARHLPSGSALVEFVLVPDWDEKRLLWTSISHYLAFILTPDNTVRLVDLGERSAIDAQVDAALTAITDPNFLKDLTAYTQKTHAALSQLYGQILQPLGSVASASGVLIVSPDGELNKVPFAALRTPEGQYLVERRSVSYVASGRDLLRGKTGVEPTMAMLLVANPAFDDRGVLRAGKFRSRPMRAPDYEKVEYPPLPGTADEAKAIPPLVRGTKKILLGKEATESAVRSTRSPQILHLATHGFFLKDRPEDEALPDPLGRGGRPVFRGGPDGPLARSGLALAGANHADEIMEGDDGILTALEVTSMDLYGTDLAVLSACETALGEIRTGQGVYGLRRAFVLAGARNLLMSLWPVSDRITRDLMERFYAAYEKGEPVAAALRAAQVETIAQLRQATSAGTQGAAFAPVNLWAPFIVQQTGEQ